MKLTKLIFIALATLLLPFFANAQDGFADWKHGGDLAILTTPDGANLPAGAVVEDFPVLVRLDKDWFDFSQARADGGDVRFATAEGTTLSYEIEEWNAAKGTAGIWVRVPKIEGNARQMIRIFWGKADAPETSDGKAVFNETNGYLSVIHMGEVLTDEVGSVETKNIGTTTTAGMIGTARHLAGQQGIFCGEKIENYPVGANPHSTEAWLRAEKSNGRALAWGNEHGQGKVIMHFQSPPHVNMECYFSGANVSTEGRLPMNEWIHVVHTYQQGDSRIYVNGELSNVSKTPNAPLAIKTPARLYIGGWYQNYDFVGDIDEVRISKVTRSADWVKLQHENQKAQQTLVGPVVQPGNTFAVSPTQATVAEGKSITFTAQAGGALKLYWILKHDGRETVAAVDRFAFAFDAGRVPGDSTVTLQCKAVYPEGVKTIDIPITIKEAIPDPVFTLTAPATWDGRAAIEVVPKVENLSAMQAAGVGELKTEWSAGPFAIIKEIAPGKLILKRAQNSGKLTVTVTISNGGEAVTQSLEITTTEPKHDAWVTRAPEKDEKPVEGQFYARDENGEGTLSYNGTLTQAADSVFLKLYADDKLLRTETAKVGADKSYALSTKLKPGLIKYRVEFGVGDTVVEKVGDLVCGDAFIIDGQSNALATDTGEKSPPETNEWIRSYGRPTGNANDDSGNLWCRPVWKAQNGEKAELGWWGMELAKRLVASQQIPIFIVNAAVGGTRIDQHQRNMEDPTDLTTIYGRMLWRVRQAKLTHGIRGIIWHQGENDQGAAGPTGGFGWQTYHPYFVEMAAGWKLDFPNVQHYYVFQIWPNSCSMGGREGSGDRLREKQRTLPQLFANMDALSTLGIDPPGTCHYPLEGWAEFARMLQPLIERDFYDKVPTTSITTPNLQRASFAGGSKNEIALEFDQAVVWNDSLAGQFYLDGEEGKVASGSIAGKTLTLKLKETTEAKTITYLKEIKWSQDTLLKGTNDIAALTFCEVPLE